MAKNDIKQQKHKKSEYASYFEQKLKEQEEKKNLLNDELER